MNFSSDIFLGFADSFSIWLIAKFFVCFAILIYVVFGIVVVRQVFLMTETVNNQLEFPLKVISVVHFLMTIVVFLLALFIL